MLKGGAHISGQSDMDPANSTSDMRSLGSFDAAVNNDAFFLVVALECSNSGDESSS